jgi:hypothetical protein
MFFSDDDYEDFVTESGFEVTVTLYDTGALLMLPVDLEGNTEFPAADLPAAMARARVIAKRMEVRLIADGVFRDIENIGSISPGRSDEQLERMAAAMAAYPDEEVCVEAILVVRDEQEARKLYAFGKSLTPKQRKALGLSLRDLAGRDPAALEMFRNAYAAACAASAARENGGPA